MQIYDRHLGFLEQNPLTKPLQRDYPESLVKRLPYMGEIDPDSPSTKARLKSLMQTKVKANHRPYDKWL
jgi:hypothetical protein